MNIEFMLEAESEEEMEFFEQVADIRNEGLDSGLSRQEVSRVFLVFAQGLLSESFKDDSVPVPEDDEWVCPACGGPLVDIDVPGIGEDPVVDPCRCVVPFNDLPQEVIDETLDS